MINDVRMTLDRLITERGDSYASVSDLLGRNAAYIQQFIKRGTPRKLDERDRQILARYFGVPETLLGAAARQGQPSRSPRDELAVVSIPRLAIGVSAGSGTLDTTESRVGAIAFDAQWLRQLGLRPQRASIIHVAGESMLPTLNDGDDILVDHDDGPDRIRDGLYVLRLDGVLMVKRIATGPLRGSFSVISDNPLYPAWKDVDPAILSIIGRVVWVGHAVR
ncbi:S24 family peptidase [Sphingobium sp. CCH11-B1]|jgi:phage repressor protein C with HTH and peptisase S24 domain|uniref:S24 family peptidase n=1 Tax=Sphingobium sp. CCH11-B1 TaxID=1768781 RepID=UPI0009E9F111|nr:S24 family peptidase [Sphingobium sp. CCH11-B1]